MGAHKRWAWARLIEAKRNRDLLNAAATFVAPPPVIADLVGKVGTHFGGPREGRGGKRREVA